MTMYIDLSVLFTGIALLTTLVCFLGSRWIAAEWKGDKYKELYTVCDVLLTDTRLKMRELLAERDAMTELFTGSDKNDKDTTAKENDDKA
jgi:hypothetical protein